MWISSIVVTFDIHWVVGCLSALVFVMFNYSPLLIVQVCFCYHHFGCYMSFRCIVVVSLFLLFVICHLRILVVTYLLNIIVVVHCLGAFAIIYLLLFGLVACCSSIWIFTIKGTLVSPIIDTSGCPWPKATMKSPVGARDLRPLWSFISFIFSYFLLFIWFIHFWKKKFF
jgi:hypothetical protein